MTTGFASFVFVIQQVILGKHLGLLSNLTVDELGNAPDNFVSLYVVLPQEEK